MSLFVGGQWVRCSACGARFEVAPETAGAAGAAARVPTPGAFGAAVAAAGAPVVPPPAPMRASPPESPMGPPPAPLSPPEPPRASPTEPLEGSPPAEPPPEGPARAGTGPEGDPGEGARTRWLVGAAFALALVGLAVLWGVLSAPEDSGPAAPVPPAVGAEEGPLEVPLAARVDAEVSERRFDFERDAGGTWPWYTWRGHWAVADGALVHRPASPAPERIPRAFLGRERYYAEGFRIEARLSLTPVDTAADEAPAAKLYLYRNRRRFLALTVEPGPGGRYGVVWDLGDGVRYGGFEGGEGPQPPAAGQTVEAALWVDAGVLHAAIDGREVGRARLEGLGDDDWGKAGVGCRAARCRIEALVVAGRTRHPPGAQPDLTTPMAPAEP